MRLLLSSLQWFVFLLAGSVVAPLAIGSSFGLSVPEIAGFVARTFFVAGLVSFFQCLFGHRLPIAEGPAVLWWSVFLVFLEVSGNNGSEVLPAIEFGLLFSGVLFLVISLFGWLDRLKKIFTPLVTGTYFILLVAQISGPFVNGVLGTNFRGNGIEAQAAFAAVATAVVTVLLSFSRNRWLSQYAVLYGLLFGWALFQGLQLTTPIQSETVGFVHIPDPLSWGLPRFDTGVLVTTVFITFLLMINVIASIDVVEKVAESRTRPRFHRAGLFMGVSQALSGFFSTIGLVPLSYTAGFITATRMKERGPFLIGSFVLFLISFFPKITLFFASIPPPVGYASMLLAFANMIGLGMREYARVSFHERNLFIISLSLMIGIGCLFIPHEAIAQFPPVIAAIANNGLVVGVLLCLGLERMLKGRNNG